MEKYELVLSALQQRIGEMAASYESQIAVLRAEVTILSNEIKKQQEMQEYSEQLQEKINL